MPHELFLRTRQKAKMRNALTNNMSKDIKLRKAQLSKIIQSDGLLGALFSKLAGPVTKVVHHLAKNVLGAVALDTAIDSAIQRKCVGEEL